VVVPRAPAAVERAGREPRIHRPIVGLAGPDRCTRIGEARSFSPSR
jgi:hypothetical protein